MLPTPPPSIGSDSSCSDTTLRGQYRWWNVNINDDRSSSECPEFLLGVSIKDITIMSTLQHDYKLTGWDEARYLIETKQIDRFRRTPTDLRRYHEYIRSLEQKYGSVLHFMQYERLQWPDLRPSKDTPLTNPSDYKILFNDWHYALEPDITHLVVWTKFTLEDDPGTGELTPEAETLIEEFVMRTFCSPDERNERNHPRAEDEGVMKRDNLIWFKNWARLRSVRALEHFHIMLYKAPENLLQRVTQGDKPMSETFSG